MRKFYFAAFAILATAAQAQPKSEAPNAASPDPAREKAEVIALFDVLTTEMFPRSGIGGDAECVFQEDWSTPVYQNPNSKNAKTPEPLLTLRQALDPKGTHAEMFCDRDKRDHLVQTTLTKAKADGQKDKAGVLDVNYSYPVFNDTLTAATVYYKSQSFAWTAADAQPTYSSHSKEIRLTKNAAGKWTAKYTDTPSRN